MNNAVFIIALVYVVLITYFIGRSIAARKDSMKNGAKKNKTNSSKLLEKRKTNNFSSDYDITAEYYDEVADSLDTKTNETNDDELFDREFKRSRKVRGGASKSSNTQSGKNLQYKMLKDSFQIVDNGSAVHKHLDSMCDTSIGEFGA